MEILLSFWTLGLAIWTLYLILRSIALGKRKADLYAQQMLWMSRAEKANRDALWKKN